MIDCNVLLLGSEHKVWGSASLNIKYYIFVRLVHFMGGDWQVISYLMDLEYLRGALHLQ